VTAIEVACRVCARQPYEACIMPDGSPAPFTHACRIEDADAISEPAKDEDPALVDKAIEAVVDEIA
jgi:hypothetical protein